MPLLKKNNKFLLIAFYVILSLVGPNTLAKDFKLNEGWRIRSSQSSDWYPAQVPSTVLGVLTQNGLYQDAFVGDNYHQVIDRNLFADSWIYETEFFLPQLEEDDNVFLDFEGLNYYANIWLNGKQIASKEDVYGPFRQFKFNVTNLLSKQNNLLRVELFRAQDGDFNIGFVDWNPRPADESMGIFRPVWLRFSKDVSLESSAVRSKVDTASLKRAWLSVETTLTNNTEKEVSGYLLLKMGGKKYKKSLTLSAKQQLTLSIDSQETSMLYVKNPKLWWCHNMGTPYMHNMELSFVVDGKVSDSQTVNFGIRQIDTYFTPEGHKGFILNGKKVLVKGAGWTDDIFLRNPDSRNQIELSYVKDMNLNAVRFENVWGTSQNVYELCDKMGLLALVGWSCFWEWEVYSKTPNDQYGCIKTEQDMNLIAQSLEHQVKWLRNHPSIIAWYVGSDMLPRPELEKKYLEVLEKTDDRPYVAAAKALVSEVTGPTGMKMVGPYDYQAPSYWYNSQAPGGSIGFNTETGIGAQMPMRESIEKMIPRDQLWPVGEAYDYHCTTAGEAMHSLDVLKEIIDQRYGQAVDLDDFLKKAHHLDYDGTRAMFEGFRVNRPKSTGVIQWMLNSAWPSLYWQLYDWYLVPTASYYSVKKACAPKQLVYNYEDKHIYSVNDEASSFKGEAHYALYDIKGKLISEQLLSFSIDEDSSLKLCAVPEVDGVSFLFLTLNDSKGREIQSNSYVLSSKDDITDWEKYNWIRTPLKQCADYTALNSMGSSKLSYSLKKISENQYEVSVTNNSEVVAFFVNISLKDEKGDLVVPALWEDNFFSMKPGQTKTVKCKLLNEQSKLQLDLKSWNSSVAQ